MYEIYTRYAKRHDVILTLIMQLSVEVFMDRKLRARRSMIWIMLHICSFNDKNWMFLLML